MEGVTFTPEAADRISRAVEWVESHSANHRAASPPASSAEPVLVRVTSTPNEDGYYEAVVTSWNPEDEDWEDFGEVMLLPSNGEAFGVGARKGARAAGVTEDGYDLYVSFGGTGLEAVRQTAPNLLLGHLYTTSYPGIDIIDFCSETGFSVTQDTAGQVRLEMLPATTTQTGVVNLANQTWKGTKAVYAAGNSVIGSNYNTTVFLRARGEPSGTEGEFDDGRGWVGVETSYSSSNFMSRLYADRLVLASTPQPDLSNPGYGALIRGGVAFSGEDDHAATFAFGGSSQLLTVLGGYALLSTGADEGQAFCTLDLFASIGGESYYSVTRGGSSYGGIDTIRHGLTFKGGLCVGDAEAAYALTTTQIATTHSLTGGGDLSSNRTLSLVGDTAAPGANKRYGTDSGGTRGWFDLLPAGYVTDAMLRDSAATSIVGRAGGSTGAVSDITASADGQFLRRSGGALGFGPLASGDLPSHTHSAADVTSGTLAVARGGTGVATTPANGQLLIGDGSGYTVAAITAGNGVGVTNGSGSISLAVTTQMSVAVDGSGVKLSGDSGSPGNSKYYGTDSGGTRGYFALPTGSVTSVALAAPSSLLSVSGSPVTSSGTLTLALANASQNYVWAGPIGGGAGAPSYRKLDSNDYDDGTLSYAKLININATSVLGRSANSTGAVAPIAAGSDGQFLRRSGGTLGFAAIVAGDLPAASDSAAGTIEVATQSEMESASSATLAVTPGRLQYHPGAAKFWVNFNGTGTIAIRSSHNVASLTDNAAGDYTVNIATDFSSADWCVTVAADGGGSAHPTNVTTPIAAGTIRVRCRDTAHAVADTAYVFIAGFGDQ